MHYGMGMGQKPTTLVPQFPVLSVLLVKTQVFNNHLHIMSIFVHLPIPQAHSSSISLANLFARFMKSSASTCGVGRHGPADPSIRNSMFLTSWEARHTLRWCLCQRFHARPVECYIEDCTSSLGVQHRAMALVVIR